MNKSNKTVFYVGGCSGSFSPKFQRAEFGNLTSAFGVQFEEEGYFIDNGTGAGKVSDFLLAQEVKRVHGLQSHFHIDHFSGIHGNDVLFVPGLVEHFYIPKFCRRSVGNNVSMYFGKETWPIAPAELSIQEFKPGTNLKAALGVRTLLQNHPGKPGGSVAYRIGTPCGDIVVATDGEPVVVTTKVKGKKDKVTNHVMNMAKFISGATLAYMDVQYRQAEYDGTLAICGGKAISRKGWGHGTPEMLFQILAQCKDVPKKIFIGHHDPSRTTGDLFVFEQEIKNHLIGFRTEVQFAREGDVIEL